MTRPLILVVGATGTVGTVVVRHLVKAGRRVRAMVRDAAKAHNWGEAVEVVVGDLAEPETLGEAFAGADKVFVLAPPTPDLERLEANAFEAGKGAGAQHIVHLSNFGAGSFEGAIWRWHGASERLQPRSAAAEESIRKLIGYHEGQRKRVGYDELRQRGLPRGSGGIESENKLICHVRLKRSGARWLEANGNAMLRIRCALYNGTFKQIFADYMAAQAARDSSS